MCEADFERDFGDLDRVQQDRDRMAAADRVLGSAMSDDVGAHASFYERAHVTTRKWNLARSRRHAQLKRRQVCQIEASQERGGWL